MTSSNSEPGGGRLPASPWITQNRASTEPIAPFSTNGDDDTVVMPAVPAEAPPAPPKVDQATPVRPGRGLMFLTGMVGATALLGAAAIALRVDGTGGRPSRAAVPPPAVASSGAGAGGEISPAPAPSVSVDAATSPPPTTRPSPPKTTTKPAGDKYATAPVPAPMVPRKMVGAPNLVLYCTKHKFGAPTLVVTDPAVNGWRCVAGKTITPIGAARMTEACREQYGEKAVAWFYERTDASSWRCFR